MSAAEGHSCHLQRESFSFQRGRCILSSAVSEHLLSRQPRPLEGKTHVHRARYCSHFAAVGSLSMPSATLSRQNRGRWKPFYMSTGRAHENTSPSSPEMSRLHFTKFPLSKGKSLVSGGGAFSFQRGPVHSFICSEVIFLSARAGTGYPFICGGSHSLFSEGGAFFHLRYRSIC